MHRITTPDVPARRVTRCAADAARGAVDLHTLAPEHLAGLRVAGLVGDDGSRTALGHELRDDLAGAPVILLYAVEPAVATQRARLHVGRRRVLYIAADTWSSRRVAPLPEEAAVPGDSTMVILPADAVPVVLARWGRLRPTHETPEASYGPIPWPTFALRCRDPRVPAPTELDDAGTRLWEAPWSVWGAQCDSLDLSLSYVDAPGHGVFAVRRDGDVVHLVSRPSSLLWGDLQSVLVSLRRDRWARV